MSHLATVKVIVTDLVALEAACRDLGLQFMRDQKTCTHYNNQKGKCVHAIKVPGTTWEIGLVEAKDGKGFELTYDNYGRDGRTISQKLGLGLEKIKQHYAVAKATLTAKAKGWITQRTTMPNGSIRLVMSGV